jgi:integrase
MAWIEQHRRADGGLTARVIWRPGGARDATRVWETFSAGSDAQNLARADGFKRMVEAAGQRWPDGWVKGEGFVRPPDVADPMTPPPSFDKIGEGHVRQIVDLSPGQRKRYLGQLQVLARTPVRGSLVFAGPVTAIGEAQLKTWLIEWDRSLKTKANYHGLIYGVFAYAMTRGYLAANPAIGTAPKQSRVKQSRPVLRFLTERELETAVRLAKRHGDVLAVTAGTGLRFGEISALWVGDVDLDRGTVRVNKAWKRNGEDGRTITMAPTVADLLEKRIKGRPADDFVFTSRTGQPLHNGDFYTHVWRKLMTACASRDAAGRGAIYIHNSVRPGNMFVASCSMYSSKERRPKRRP